MRMNQESITKAVVRWIPPNGKRKPGRPRTDWIQTVNEGIKREGAGWEQGPQLAVSRKTWKELTALCATGT